MKRVTLLKPHTHEGVQHASGITLNVPDHVARWLLDYRIAVPAARAITTPAPLPIADLAAAPEPAGVADLAAGSASISETPVPRIADTDTTGATP